MNLKRIFVIIIISNLLHINTTKINKFIVSITTITALITPKIVLGSTESEINKIAAEITVRIDGQNRSGSGVIVEKQGETYYVLTNWHVVNRVADYQIRTPDGRMHPVYYSLIKQVPNLDLAIVPFSSSQNYPIAKTGDSTQLVPGTKVFVGGWPRSGSNLQQRIFLSTAGKVTGRQQPVAGYSLLYDNLVRAGMSGGPVLDGEGRLVAINGIVKLQENSDIIVSGGIEINTFWNWRKRVSLPTISPAPETLSTPPTPTETTTSVPTSTVNFTLAKTITDQINGIVNSIVALNAYIVMGDSNGLISVWDIESGEIIATWKAHPESVNSVAVTPDQQFVISGSDDKTIKIWQLPKNKNVTNITLVQTLTGHTDVVDEIAIAPSGQFFASGSWDKTIKIWNLSSGELGQTLAENSQIVNAIAISPDGKFLASGGKDNQIKLWSLATGKLVRSLNTNSLSTLSLTFSPNSQILASGSSDGMVNIWNLKTGELIHNLKEHIDGVWSIVISPNGKTLISGSWDKTIKFWELNTGELKRSLKGHNSYVSAVAISPNGEIIVSGGWDRKINIWKVP
ncbi:trypsin-like peptidase domain-containing protein [Okeania sp.]|uniref:trypsin-like peptidase domain-containing protein n=1 Tax=Okeania sp. TaxID=3100323 RepID=UPI002B4B8D2C|nr:trypsin-like peptidase domain-containing protein [Okeania sp.]MEB3340430.1 trypsin-like peptidase domain-containing protein [Okeania sp.]